MEIKFLENIAKKFEIEGNIISIQELTSGHINENYLIETTSGKKYVLRKINTKVFENPDALCFNVMVIDSYIRENIAKFNFSDPSRQLLTFITSVDGEICVETEECVWQATLFIDNSITYNIVNDTNLAYGGGKIFGKFQKILNEIDASLLGFPIENFHNLSFRIAQYYEALENDKVGRASAVMNEIERIEGFVFIAERFEMIAFDGLPTRVTHNDTKISNVLFDAKTKNPLCVIDYDTIMPSNVLCDFGDMVRSYTNSSAEDEKDLTKVGFRLDLFEHLAKGYLSELKTELTEFELLNLVFGAEMIIYEQAVRFLTDYLNGDVYYKTKYEEHNLVRAKNQLALLQSLMENEPAAEEIIAEIIEGTI